MVSFTDRLNLALMSSSTSFALQAANVLEALEDAEG
jgi:hypothetical protein